MNIPVKAQNGGLVICKAVLPGTSKSNNKVTYTIVGDAGTITENSGVMIAYYTTKEKRDQVLQQLYEYWIRNGFEYHKSYNCLETHEEYIYPMVFEMPTDDKEV